MKTLKKLIFATFLLGGLGLLSEAALAQETAAPSVRDAVAGYEGSAHQTFQGVATDWSGHHVVYSKPEPGSDAENAVQQDPRYWMQQIRRARPDADEAEDVSANAEGNHTKKNRHRKSKLTLDWSQSLGTGGTVGNEMFPATFTSTTSASCDSAGNPDYAAFNTSLAGSGTQASLVAFDNLYATTCSGTVPLTYWAYDTGGTILTSPTLSSDGTQLAFVQSVVSVANLVILKWRKTPATHSFSATTANGTPNLTAGTFAASDVGAQITAATGIPTGTTIIAVLTSSTATMSANATAGGARTVTINAETVTLPGVPPTVSNANYHSCTAPCMTTIAFNGNPNDTNSSAFDTFINPDTVYAGDNAGKLHKFTNIFTTAASPSEVTTGGWPVTVGASALSSPIADVNTHNIFVGDSAGNLRYVRDTGSGTGACGAGSPPCLGTPAIALGGSVVDGPLLDVTTTKVFWFQSLAKSGTSTLTDKVEQTDEALANPVTLTFANGNGTVRTGNMHQGAFDNLYFNSPASGFLYFCALNPGSGNHPSLWRVGFTGAGGTMNGATNGGPTELASPSSNNECSPVTEFANVATDRVFVSVQNNDNMAGNCTGSGTGCIYSFPVGRIVNDGHTTNASTTVTSATANFVAGDVGASIAGTNIPAGATIATRTSATTITISAPATGTTTTANLTVGLTAANFPALSVGLNETGGTSGIVIDNALPATGASQVYFSPLSGGAVQASQSNLQ